MNPLRLARQPTSPRHEEIDRYRLLAARDGTYMRRERTPAPPVAHAHKEEKRGHILEPLIRGMALTVRRAPTPPNVPPVPPLVHLSVLAGAGDAADGQQSVVCPAESGLCSRTEAPGAN